MSESGKKLLAALIQRLEWEYETNENHIIRFDDVELDLIMRLLRKEATL